MINPELALRIVRESPIIAFDTETSGLTLTDFICGWVITDRDHSIYIPVRHEPGGNIPDVEGFETALAAAFLDRTRLGHRTIGHHLGFDLRIAARHGVILGAPLEDTMINESLISDITVGYGLDVCSRRHGVTVKLGSELYAEIARKFGGLPDKKQMGKFWRMPGDNEFVVDYATGDGVSTLELWEAQQDILSEDDLRTVWQLECDLLPYLARIHSRGLRVDPDYSVRVQEDINESIVAASSQFSKGFNARSPIDVETLYRANGYTDTQFVKTATGKVSFTEKWLETNEIGGAILGVRRLEKARDSFIAPLVDTHNHGGRVYPILNQSKSDDYGVAGARLSCSEPNLQAFPKRNIDVGRVVRRLIIPDGAMLIEEADAKQQEPRLFTHFSEEPALVEGYTNGTMDMHDHASRILGIERETAKRLSMGMLTMMSIPTLAGHMRCSENEAKAMHKAFLSEAFPQINIFQNTCIAKWREKKVVTTILGRRAHLDDPRFAYRAVSRVIQNNGGDHIKLCMLRASQYEDAYPDKFQVLLSIHDSLIWQRDPDHPPTEIMHIIENVANEMGLVIPIPFGLGTGRDWARASYGEKLDKYDD